MNETSPEKPASAPERAYHNFWPVCVLAATLLIVFVWQTSNAWKQQGFLKQQKQQRQELVVQSQAAQTALQRLMEDLLDLAQTDPEAKALVDKYKVVRH
jgi:uncharacterized protein YlxW (UPF0749 family)